MQVLGKAWQELPLPPLFVIGFLSLFLFSVSDPFSPPLLSVGIAVPPAVTSAVG
jgi:hypothetical protein